MRTNRFFIDFDPKAKEKIITDRAIANQIHSVLRLRTGDLITLADGAMNEAVAEIVESGKGVIRVKLLSTTKNKNESPREVLLYCALLKKENFELVVQKSTEIGVREIIPLLTEHTVKLGFKRDRLEKIIKEAAEQSGRGIIPKLHDPLPLSEALKHAGTNIQNFFCELGSRAEIQHLPSTGKFGVFIGPEGGWSDAEAAEAKKHNLNFISLGNLTLRAETAATIAPYFLLHAR